MEEFRCEDCGHVNEIDIDQLNLSIKNVFNWRQYLPQDLITALEQKSFKKAKSDNEDKIKYETLFVSAVCRRTLKDLLGRDDVLSLQDDITTTFHYKLWPVLDTIHRNFKILGHLCLPSAIKLAITDLTQPVCVFCFVTIEHDSNLQRKLDELDLSRLNKEGLVDSVSNPPFKFFEDGAI